MQDKVTDTLMVLTNKDPIVLSVLAKALQPHLKNPEHIPADVLLKYRAELDFYVQKVKTLE